MRHGLRITALFLAVGLVVLAAGCGGGTNNAAPTTAGKVGSTGATGATGATGDTGSFASSKNCLEFASLAAKIASTMNPTTGDKSSLDDATRTFQALAEAAPDDIKGDLQTFASAFADYVQAIQSSGYDPSSKTPPTSAQIAALVQAARVFNTPKLKQAEQHLSSWEQQNCKMR